MKRITAAAIAATTLMSLAPACDFDSALAPRAELEVVVDGQNVAPHTTNLGYVVELERCRVAIDTVEFTTDGESHAALGRGVVDSVLRTAQDLVVPTAYAHPGHYAGGEIVGELPGRFVFDWRSDGQVLGEATMLAAQYSGANFTFARAEPSDGVRLDDPIIGHTFDIAGEATYEGETITFEIQVDQDADRRVVGLPFDLSVDEDSDDAIGLSLHLADPFESDTAFDDVDFLSLDDDGDGHVVITADSEAYNRIRRALQAHDFYGTELR